jgi:transcriptional regulator with XRE-family HTH domain
MFQASVKTCTHCNGGGQEIDSVATGLALRELRIAKHTTLSTVADRLHISKPYLSDLENGKRNWRLELINRFLQALR